MKTNRIPRREDAVEVDFEADLISVVPVADEDKDVLVDAVFSTYLGEKCKYCGKKYRTLDDLRDTVWAGDHKDGRLACRSCWSANNEAGALITHHAID